MASLVNTTEEETEEECEEMGHSGNLLSDASNHLEKRAINYRLHEIGNYIFYILRQMLITYKQGWDFRFTNYFFLESVSETLKNTLLTSSDEVISNFFQFFIF
jgi:hypothetical protein